MNELTSDEKLAPLRTLTIAVYALQAAGFSAVSFAVGATLFQFGMSLRQAIVQAAPPATAANSHH